MTNFQSILKRQSLNNMQVIDKYKVRELRCENCRAFITFEYIQAGYIVHVCPKCGHENIKVFKFLNVPMVVNSLIKTFGINLKKKKGGEK